jgi:hypothetical protein
MASSYVNDLRLNEMATGDASGTWGETTNTNLELIAEAFSYGTEAITTNADTHTTTIADGATDPGRALYLKYTGTLDSACTITIGPDTVSKVWIVENGTSGSQDIILSQGSGANITIPAGDTKVVYSDGAGAGAAFFDAFASLSVVDLKVQDDLTVTDDLIVNGDIDLEGNMDVNGSLETDALSLNGTTVTSTAAEINLLDGSSANTVVNSKAVIYGSSGEVAGTLSTAAQPNITSVGSLTALDVAGTATANKLVSDSNVDAASFTSAGSTYVDIDNGTVTGRLQTISSDFFIGTATTSTSLAFKSGNGVEAMRINSSGNVGIGTNSPSSYPVAPELVVDTGVSGGITVVSDSTSGGYGGVFFADGTTGNEQYRGFIQYNHNNGGSVDDLILGTVGTERLRIDSAGSIYGSSATGMTKFANSVSNYVSVADDGTITLTAATAGAMFIHVYDQGLGDGAVFFATYRGIAVLVTESASNTHPFSASDTDGAYCVIKTSNSHTVTFKNRTGAARQMGFLISGSNVD